MSRSPSASRWKTLTVTEADDLHADEPTVDFVLKTMNRQYDLHLLRLQELHITHNREYDVLEEGGTPVLESFDSSRRGLPRICVS